MTFNCSPAQSPVGSQNADLAHLIPYKNNENELEKLYDMEKRQIFS